MRPVTAEFRPAKAPARSHWLGAGLAAVAAAGAALLAFNEHLGHLAAQRADQAAAWARALPIPDSKPQSLPSYAKSAQSMLNERALPWASALRVLESTPLNGATPQSLETDVANGLVRVEVLARDHATLLAYVEALNAGVAQQADGLYWVILSTRAEAGSGGIAALLSAGQRSRR